MANAEITTPEGISVHVEGTPAEVAAVVEEIRNKCSKPTPRPEKRSVATAGKGQLPELVDLLKAEDYFTTPRGLGEIRVKLGELGHHYPITSLSGAMQAEVRKRNLRRFKRDGKYVYAQ